jgi:hypothetical protein
VPAPRNGGTVVLLARHLGVPSEIALSLVPAPRNGGTVVLLARHAGSVVAYRVGGLQGDCD